MTFIPTDPLTVAYMVIIWVLAAACISCGRRPDQWLGLALIVSWAMARQATVTEHPLILVAGLCVAAFLAFCGQSRAARAVCWIYGARIALSSLLLFGVIDWYWLWILNNEVFLTAQLLIVGGSLIDGTLANGRISQFMEKRANLRSYVASTPRAGYLSAGVGEP